MGGEVYDESYFLRGRETNKSLYKDYRWMPELTIPMVRAIVVHCGIEEDHSILDFGCARGYVVKALRELDFDAYGVDVSQWAIRNCDPWVVPYVYLYSELKSYAEFDWIIAKDVLEHVEHVGLVAQSMLERARRGVFVVVPLAEVDNGPYVVRHYEQDITHIHRLTLATWASLFSYPGWTVDARYRVEGVKDNYYKPKWERGNGFLTCRRIVE